MGVRNLAELGENLQKIIKRLMSNKDLVKLLYYTDKDPLSNPDLTEEQLQNEVFEKLIKITPRVGPKEDAHSVIIVRVIKGHRNFNKEFRDVEIGVEIFVPMSQLIIKDTNLRPFKIMGEVQKSLDDKTINGLGKMTGGNFEVNYFTDEVTCYHQDYIITSYN